MYTHFAALEFDTNELYFRQVCHYPFAISPYTQLYKGGMCEWGDNGYYRLFKLPFDDGKTAFHCDGILLRAPTYVIVLICLFVCGICAILLFTLIDTEISRNWFTNLFFGKNIKYPDVEVLQANETVLYSNIQQGKKHNFPTATVLLQIVILVALQVLDMLTDVIYIYYKLLSLTRVYLHYV